MSIKTTKPVEDAAKLGGQPPEYYATKAEADSKMPLAGGDFSGRVNAPALGADAVEIGGNLSTGRITFSEAGVQVGSDAAGCAVTFSTNGLYSKGHDNTWKPMLASMFSQQSSRRFKKEIRSMDEETALLLLMLRAVTFVPEWDKTDTRRIGLIAEEVEKYFPSVVTYGEHGETEGIDYASLVSPLIMLCQMQQKDICRIKSLLVEKGLCTQEETMNV